MPDIQIDEDLIVVTGFSGPVQDGIGETKDIKHVRGLIEVLTGQIKFASQKLILGCPLDHAQESPLDRVDFIRNEIGGSVRKKTVVGVSYGGLLALAEACTLDTMPQMFLIDAPLHPGIEVNPPADGRFNAFMTQYKSRKRLAACCINILKDIPDVDLNRIVTIGTTVDDIVAPDAKHLPNSNIDHVKLPSNITGHGLTADKIQAIVRIMVERLSDKQNFDI